MNKAEFMNILSKQLAGIPANERQEILGDFEEHFAMGAEAGKTEETIAESLGDPKTLAKHFRAEGLVKRAEEDRSVSNITGAVMAVISLGFFNLVFVLGPFLAVVGVIAGLFAAALGIVVGGVAALVAGLISPMAPALSNLPPVLGIFGGTGLTSLGLLFLIGDVYLGKLFYKGVVSYLKLNLKMING